MLGIRRRQFITLLGGAAVALPVPAHTQQADRIKRLGILRATTETDTNVASSEFTELLQQLEQLGWTEGRNLRVDYRPVSSTSSDAIRPHAEALARASPDVILANPAQAVQMLQRLTDTIPIVFMQAADPVQAGTVQSLTRPGGNITGFVSFEPSVNTKYLQLLKDMAPRLTRVAVLQSPSSSPRGDFAVVESVTKLFAVTAVAMVVRDDAADIERSIVTFAREPNGGLIRPPDNALTRRHGELIVALAAKHRLPAIYSAHQNVEAGGLMSYAAAPYDFRQVASYIDRILRGAKPADLPVQAPTRYGLVINLRTATELGLTIPPAVFALADRVIE